MIGKIVWRGLYGVLRFGKIVGVKTDGGWAYYQVQWIEDHPFESAKKEGLCHDQLIEEEASGWYRCDSLHEVDGERLARIARVVSSS